jgi:tetratricopeptide (TPR) repeat protein
MAPLVAAVGAERLTVARPTGGFAYGPLRSPTRGGGEPDNLRLSSEAMRLRNAADEHADADHLHAAGVGALLLGHASVAIDLLDAAARSAPENASIESDRGAAYMTRFLGDHVKSDGTAALAALDKAISLDPSLKEARFNRAILLEHLDRPADALAAWDAYLSLAQEDGWHDEAVRSRDALRRQSNGR